MEGSCDAARHLDNLTENCADCTSIRLNKLLFEAG